MNRNLARIARSRVLIAVAACQLFLGCASGSTNGASGVDGGGGSGGGSAGSGGSGGSAGASGGSAGTSGGSGGASGGSAGTSGGSGGATGGSGGASGGSGGASGTPIIKGINEHPIWYDLSDPSIFFNLDSSAGVQASRADAPWAVLQPTGPNAYDSSRVAKMDAYVDGMKARGIRVMLVVTGAPKWANGGASNLSTPPTPAHYQDYANFCAWLVNRYDKRGLEAIEVWNEPAGYWAWAPSGDNGIAYTALLKTAYPAIKAAASADNTQIEVLGVSLFSGGQDSRDRTLLNNIYANGGRDYFDIMSVHTYPKHTTSGSPTAPFYDANNLRSSIVGQWQYYTLPIMKAAGDGNKKVWFTETGVETGSTGDATRAQQAAAVTDYFTTFKSGALPANIVRVYWYQLEDREGAGDSGWGLVNNVGGTTPVASDFTYKPSFTAYKNIVP